MLLQSTDLLIYEPFLLACVYKTSCQSILSYAMELLPISKNLRQSIDSRQATQRKKDVRTKQICTFKPLLNALYIETVSELYTKHNILASTQIRNFQITNKLVITLGKCYEKLSPIKLSYFHQSRECSDKLGLNIISTNKAFVSALLIRHTHMMNQHRQSPNNIQTCVSN